MIERILKAFNKNLPIENRGSTWDWRLSFSSTVPITEENLNNMGDNNLCFGFLSGSYAANDDKSHAERAIYSFKKLAEALGTINDFQSIEEAIGFKIKLPKFIGGRKVLQTDRGILSDRHCHYLWVMKRIIELCPDRNSSIIEIGAGIGLLGYFLDCAGYRDYTSIDLAYASVCQTYFLHKNLPERDIILSGDKENPFDLCYKNSLKLLHSTDFNNIAKYRFAIMINMDGLTEMEIEEANKYISSDCAPLLLSINREDNPFKITDISKPFRNQIYRQSFLLRNDGSYIEEIYQL